MEKSRSGSRGEFERASTVFWRRRAFTAASISALVTRQGRWRRDRAGSNFARRLDQRDVSASFCHGRRQWRGQRSSISADTSRFVARKSANRFGENRRSGLSKSNRPWWLSGGKARIRQKWIPGFLRSEYGVKLKGPTAQWRGGQIAVNPLLFRDQLGLPSFRGWFCGPSRNDVFRRLQAPRSASSHSRHSTSSRSAPPWLNNKTRAAAGGLLGMKTRSRAVPARFCGASRSMLRDLHDNTRSKRSGRDQAGARRLLRKASASQSSRFIADHQPLFRLGAR